MIRLNEKGLRVYNATGGATQRPRLDWQNRIGRIAKYSRDRSIAYIVWDGTRSFDRVPVDLIEPLAGDGAYDLQFVEAGPSRSAL